MEERVNTCGDDNGGQKPGYYGTAFLRRRVKLDRHPEKSCHRFPPFIRWRAVEIGSHELARRVAELSPAQSPRALFAAKRLAVLVSVMGALAAFGFRQNRTRQIRKFDRLRR